MAREFNDYEDLLKNFDESPSGGSSRDVYSNSRDVNADSRPDPQRKGFVTDDLKPTPIRSGSSSNDMYFNKQEPPTPKTRGKGNEVFRAAKGYVPKSKADRYLDELDKEM